MLKKHFALIVTGFLVLMYVLATVLSLLQGDLITTVINIAGVLVMGVIFYKCLRAHMKKPTRQTLLG